jgi:hypothetical protein
MSVTINLRTIVAFAAVSSPGTAETPAADPVRELVAHGHGSL